MEGTDTFRKGFKRAAVSSLFLMSGFLTVFLLVPFIDPTQGEGYSRAVDEHGQPVSRALVVVDAGLPVTWEDFTYSVKSDEAGNFLFYEPEETTDPKLTRFLYVTGPVPHDAYSPINPPFNRFPELKESRFASRRILIKKNAEVDIGDVPIQVRYGAIRFLLEDRIRSPMVR